MKWVLILMITIMVAQVNANLLDVGFNDNSLPAVFLGAETTTATGGGNASCDCSAYVPYTGATSDVDLGSKQLDTNEVSVGSIGGLNAIQISKFVIGDVSYGIGFTDGSNGSSIFSAEGWLYLAGGNGFLSNNLKPYADNTYYLATNESRWTDLWQTGDHNIDSNTGKIKLGDSQNSTIGYNSSGMLVITSDDKIWIDGISHFNGDVTVSGHLGVIGDVDIIGNLNVTGCIGYNGGTLGVCQ